MAQDRLKSQVEVHWNAFNTLADSQSGANEALIRAVEVFEGAREAFTAEQSPASNLAAGAAAAAAAAVSPAVSISSGQQQQQQGAQLVSTASVPRGGANSGGGDDGRRRAYFRAEEALMLAREQLGRSEETLQHMAEEVERVRACIDEVESRQERKDVRARASIQALSRGESGCAMSPVDMARAMAGLLRMHQSEIEMQETIICGLGYGTPGETLTAYREALRLRPFMDDRFRSEVHEMRELSQELENPRTGV